MAEFIFRSPLGYWQLNVFRYFTNVERKPRSTSRELIRLPCWTLVPRALGRFVVLLLRSRGQHKHSRCCELRRVSSFPPWCIKTSTCTCMFNTICSQRPPVKISTPPNWIYCFQKVLFSTGSVRTGSSSAQCHLASSAAECCGQERLSWEEEMQITPSTGQQEAQVLFAFSRSDILVCYW